jgi:DNA polymerase kappa
MPVNNLVPEDIPSLYPSYLPYTVQHAILNTAQRVLEECCFEFAQQWLPSVLRSRQWDCAVAVELTKWTRILSKSSAELPADALKLRGSELTEILFTTNKLRHTAVHRLPTTARGIDAFLQAASKLAEALQDSLRTAQLDELHSELENKIKAMELNKNALEDGLSRELRDIRRQREVLDQKEREVKEAMVKEDGENKALIGSLLEESVRRIFAEGGVLRGEERERALDDSEDEDAAAYKEACEEASPQGSE